MIYPAYRNDWCSNNAVKIKLAFYQLIYNFDLTPYGAMDNFYFMTIVYLKRLEEFGRKHAQARKSLTVWKLVTEAASWKMKKDVLYDFPKAKMIRNNRARFEIVHNLFRLIAVIHYEDQLVEIRFVGTHNEYDKINPETI